jgi:putative FmdB family regulatory protein
MPTFDYSCPDCGSFEEFVNRASDAVRCKCGREARRAFSPTTFVNAGMGTEPERMSAGARQMALKNQAWLSSPEMQEKRRTGEIEVKEAGPLSLRPAYDKRLH